MNIKALLLGTCLAASTLLAPTLQAATEMLDQVVAVVDDDIIMASELRQRLAEVRETLSSRGVEMPPEDVLIRETLDRLILDSIQMQKARRAGVRISDAQLNAAVGRIAAQSGMNLDQFRMALEQQGQSYADMREEVRRQMIIQRVQMGNVNQRIQISEQEVDNYMATEEGQKMTQPEYRILHALVAVSPSATETEAADAEAFVESVLARIRGGEPFDQAVSAPGRYTFSGGDLGWRKLDDLPSLFSDVAPGLSEGATSDPLRSASGFHLVHMAAKRGGTRMVAQTNVRHILIKPSEIMTDQQARELAADLKRRVEAGEDFGELAREYSEDIGSAQEGGDLGWTSPGQMVPEFETAMAETEVGEISDPVRSQFGWHIVNVMDRRDQDMSREAARNQAMDYLHSRKYQEELDAWLRQIRDEAFVDIK